MKNIYFTHKRKPRYVVTITGVAPNGKKFRDHTNYSRKADAGAELNSQRAQFEDFGHKVKKLQFGARRRKNIKLKSR